MPVEQDAVRSRSTMPCMAWRLVELVVVLRRAGSLFDVTRSITVPVQLSFLPARFVLCKAAAQDLTFKSRSFKIPGSPTKCRQHTSGLMPTGHSGRTGLCPAPLRTHAKDRLASNDNLSSSLGRMYGL